MKCLYCGNGYVNVDETWSCKGSLSRTNWTPYRDYQSVKVAGVSCSGTKQKIVENWELSSAMRPKWKETMVTGCSNCRR